ncbi:MAG: sigma-70 family RNA polymerase sigma factor [Chloracidobacterium sp.]|nr:sigma-70 family RNA polymerase sigma factor [Chloracidobacterium sp.]
MANPIVSKLQTSPGSPPPGGPGDAHDREGFVAESLKLIRKVIAGRRSVPIDDVPDISQEIVLRLWKWRTKFEDKSARMADVDWLSFTARTTHNEVNRNLSNRGRHLEVSIDEVELSQGSQISPSDETFQLVEIAWQGICKLSLHQRQASFQFGRSGTSAFQFGIEEDEFLRSLRLSRESWKTIAAKMPLNDSEIAEIANLDSSFRQRGTTAGAIKKARCDARKKLKELMK